MLCYLDKTFCSAKCATTDCHRLLTDKVREDAAKWWGDDNPPMAIMNFQHNCLDYVPAKSV